MNLYDTTITLVDHDNNRYHIQRHFIVALTRSDAYHKAERMAKFRATSIEIHECKYELHEALYDKLMAEAAMV
jgi:hypothetical protein